MHERPLAVTRDDVNRATMTAFVESQRRIHGGQAGAGQQQRCVGRQSVEGRGRPGGNRVDSAAGRKGILLRWMSDSEDHAIRADAHIVFHRYSRAGAMQLDARCETSIAIEQNTVTGVRCRFVECVTQIARVQLSSCECLTIKIFRFVRAHPAEKVIRIVGDRTHVAGGNVKQVRVEFG